MFTSLGVYESLTVFSLLLSVVSVCPWSLYVSICLSLSFNVLESLHILNLCISCALVVYIFLSLCALWSLHISVWASNEPFCLEVMHPLSCSSLNFCVPESLHVPGSLHFPESLLCPLCLVPPWICMSLSLCMWSKWPNVHHCVRAFMSLCVFQICVFLSFCIPKFCISLNFRDPL